MNNLFTNPKLIISYIAIPVALDALILSIAEQLGLKQGILLFAIIFIITISILLPWIGWNIVYKKLKPSQKLLSESGIFNDSSLAILSRRIDIPRERWIELLRDSRQSFDSLAMASWHYVEHPDFFSILEKKIKNTEVQFRFFMLHPESKYAKFREIEEKKSKLPLRERIVKSINLLIGWVNEPGKDERKDRVRIYCFDWYPTYSIVRSDNIMYVSNYLFCDTGDFAPTLILSNTGEDSPFNTYIENLRLLINAGVAKLVKR